MVTSCDFQHHSHTNLKLVVMRRIDCNLDYCVFFSDRMEVNVFVLMCHVPWIKSASGKMDKVTFLVAIRHFSFVTYVTKEKLDC